MRTAGGGRPRAVRASGPTASPRVPGRVAEGGKEEGAGGRRKAGGGVWAGHAAPASARRSRARSQGRPRLSAHRSDSRLEPPGPLCPGPALPCPRAGRPATGRARPGPFTWPRRSPPRRHLGLGLLLPPAEGLTQGPALSDVGSPGEKGPLRGGRATPTGTLLPWAAEFQRLGTRVLERRDALGAARSDFCFKNAQFSGTYT